MTAATPKLSENARRYLADALIFELKLDNRWTRRRLPEAQCLVRSETPGEAPPFHAVGVGKETKPPGTIDVLEFKVPPLPELAIPPYLVALDEWTYSDYRMELWTERRLEHLDSLLAMRSDSYVYSTAYNGYGNTNVPTMRKSKSVSTEQVRTALELIDRAQLWLL